MAASLDDLVLDAAEHIASFLLDERDLAALAQTCRFWRDVLARADLWQELLELRFGEQAQDPRSALPRAALACLNPACRSHPPYSPPPACSPSYSLQKNPKKAIC